MTILSPQKHTLHHGASTSTVTKPDGRYSYTYAAMGPVVYGRKEHRGL